MDQVWLTTNSRVTISNLVNDQDMYGGYITRMLERSPTFYRILILCSFLIAGSNLQLRSELKQQNPEHSISGKYQTSPTV